MPRDTWWNLPDAKRLRITKVAMIEFGQRGFSAGSLNVIAREAGIAKGSLFQYFDDKLDLFATMCEEASVAIQKATLVGVDLDNDPYFAALRKIVHNWLAFFRRHPVERGVAFAAANEVDADARAAVRSVANAHFVDAFRPFVKAAAARGELRDDVDLDQLIAMTVLLMRHLDSAPFYPHVDPILGLAGKRATEVERVALELVDALERAYGRDP